MILFLRFGVLIWDSTCFFYDATSTTVVAIRAPTIVFVPSPQYIHNVVEYKKSGLLNMIRDVKVGFQNIILVLRNLNFHFSLVLIQSRRRDYQ